MNNPFSAEVHLVDGKTRVIRYARRMVEDGMHVFFIKGENGAQSGAVLVNPQHVICMEIDRLPDGPGPKVAK
jgi:hypothetical protein